MSVSYGKHWKIGGLIAGPISGGGMNRNGVYSMIFERENGATLESIEAIDWARPKVQRLPACPASEEGLPEGYGFELGNIEYHHNTRHFTVTVTTARQYLGDVTGFQARVKELEEQTTALSGQVTEARTKEAELASAYEEGVESNG